MLYGHFEAAISLAATFETYTKKDSIFSYSAKLLYSRQQTDSLLSSLSARDRHDTLSLIAYAKFVLRSTESTVAKREQSLR